MKIKKRMLQSVLLGIFLLSIYTYAVQSNSKHVQETFVVQQESTEKEVPEEYGLDSNRFQEIYKEESQYLLYEAKDIMNLAKLVNNGEEIEPGVLASEATYLLYDDIELKASDGFIGIGTKENPFHGKIDGLNHTLGVYSLADYEKEIRYVISEGDGEALNLNVKNLLKEKFGNDNLYRTILNVLFTVELWSTSDNLYIMISNQEECDDLVRFLSKEYRAGDIELKIAGKVIDTSELAYCLNQNNDITAEVIWDGNDLKKSGEDLSSVDGFLSLLKNRQLPASIETFVERKQLYQFKRQNVNGLLCSSFRFEEVFIESELPLLILAEGTWEGQEGIDQLLTIKAPEIANMSNDICIISAEDVNFDGFLDLMIHMGSSGGSGGGWNNYRSAVWNPAENEFSYFPSMPEQINIFDSVKKRMVHYGRCGMGDETIITYQVIDGEYKEATKLNLVGYKWPYTLYHYEFGELIEEITIDEEDPGTVIDELFPDLSFWGKV